MSGVWPYFIGAVGGVCFGLFTIWLEQRSRRKSARSSESPKAGT